MVPKGHIPSEIKCNHVHCTRSPEGGIEIIFDVSGNLVKHSLFARMAF